MEGRPVIEGRGSKEMARRQRTKASKIEEGLDRKGGEMGKRIKI